MNLYKMFLGGILAAAAACGFTACDGDPELPPVFAPEATIEANTTILEMKTQYWSSDRNYADTVGLTPDGKHVIVSGRVISCDSTGNIYKSLIIQDKTAAMAISIDTTKLYMNYPVGEEVLIDLTGCYVGKYNGLFQMGKPNPYNGTYEISFMKYSAFAAVSQRNGLPNVNDIDTLTTTIEQINNWTSEADIIKNQSRLIRLDSVSFVGGGTLTWADNGNNVNRSLRDKNGQTLTVRNSGYASFGRDVMPAGTGSVVCILSYYGTGWQLLFRTALDCFGFDGVPTGDTPGTVTPDLPDVPNGDGTADSPLSVPQVIQGATGTDKWVTGYIVGWVDGASITDGCVFSATSETASTSVSNILLAATPDEKNIANCIPLQLPANTDVRTKLNLKDNPTNLGKQVSVLGSLEKYFQVPGVKSVSDFSWGDKGGVSTPDEPAEPATEATFTVAKAIASGSSYAIVAEGKVAKPLSSTYGYLPVADVTVTEGTLSTPDANAFKFTETADKDGYYITDSNGKYLYMTGEYNSFNVADKAEEGAVWTVTVKADGTFSITNKTTGKTVQYSSQYTSYGAYSDTRGTLPVLYVKSK